MPDRRRVLVAVDGPSGSGKSSVSREVARRSGLAYLDTGAMYRAACWAALRDGVDVTDPVAAAVVARAVTLDLSTDPDHERVAVDGVDVTAGPDGIRGERVTSAVSAFAAHPGVREELRARQRDVMDAAPDGCIAEGRDITTVVAPDADVRVLLTADADARVERRRAQVVESGSGDAVEVVDVRAGVVGRDAADSRVTSFLSAADGVVTLDSSALTFEQTVQAVLRLVREVQRAPEGVRR
ncbi:(d)CMP kinase [Aquipuribacter nitratireducens]|uniref:Cytidylate kinase n=1 Tax=Aquipuribacter nitratireducens TaxID=650104 RepID=A0ABW0GSD8_9MICO